MTAIKILAALSCFVSANLTADGKDLPSCRDLWSVKLPDSIKQARKQCFWKALENDDLANDYIGFVKEIISTNSTDPWKVDIFDDYKARCLNSVENREFKEAYYCGQEVIEGKCKES